MRALLPTLLWSARPRLPSVEQHAYLRGRVVLYADYLRPWARGGRGGGKKRFVAFCEPWPSMPCTARGGRYGGVCEQGIRGRRNRDAAVLFLFLFSLVDRFRTVRTRIWEISLLGASAGLFLQVVNSVILGPSATNAAAAAAAVMFAGRRKESRWRVEW